MIRQLFLIGVWWIFSYAYIIIFPLIIINGRNLGNNEIVDKLSVFIKSLTQLVMYLTFTLVSKVKMFIHEIDMNIREKMTGDTDKIDIIIPNHISGSDGAILPILKYFGINSYIHLFKKVLIIFLVLVLFNMLNLILLLIEIGNKIKI
jgi:hypothetical protein